MRSPGDGGNGLDRPTAVPYSPLVPVAQASATDVPVSGTADGLAVISTSSTQAVPPASKSQMLTSNTNSAPDGYLVPSTATCRLVSKVGHTSPVIELPSPA